MTEPKPTIKGVNYDGFLSQHDPGHKERVNQMRADMIKNFHKQFPDAAYSEPILLIKSKEEKKSRQVNKFTGYTTVVDGKTFAFSVAEGTWDDEKIKKQLMFMVEMEKNKKVLS